MYAIDSHNPNLKYCYNSLPLSRSFFLHAQSALFCSRYDIIAHKDVYTDLYAYICTNKSMKFDRYRCHTHTHTSFCIVYACVFVWENGVKKMSSRRVLYIHHFVCTIVTVSVAEYTRAQHVQSTQKQAIQTHRAQRDIAPPSNMVYP